MGSAMGHHIALAGTCFLSFHGSILIAVANESVHPVNNPIFRLIVLRDDIHVAGFQVLAVAEAVMSQQCRDSLNQFSA